MTQPLRDAFADTAFWIALVDRRERFHFRAKAWSCEVTGKIVTTSAVLLETANSLSRHAWRSAVIDLIDHVLESPEFVVVEVNPDLWRRCWDLYRNRQDKQWSLTDCISFEVMRAYKLVDALTMDTHFEQAGFRAILLED